MLRDHLSRRALRGLAAAAEARNRALRSRAAFLCWSANIRRHSAAMLDLADLSQHPLRARRVSRHVYPHHVVENVLFESLHGWEVNGSVFVPRDPLYRPPYPAVVVPCGHSTKTGPDYQLVCQVFARGGFVAILFDTPGQGTEKNPGNDHFLDGARCYAVGHNSQRYFVADAIRAMDYLETRRDVDTRPGFAVTGVSGGGHTAIWTALVDRRVRLCAPACCATSLADHPIADGYAGCTEGLPAGRLSEGLDDVDQMAALAPMAQLFMSGAADEVMTPVMSRRLARVVSSAYRTAGAARNFAFRLQPTGHAYTPPMARLFVRFADGHWLRRKARVYSAAFAADPALLPAEHLFCHPAPEPNMWTISTAAATRLRRTRPRIHTRESARRAVSAVVPGVGESRIQKVIRGDRQAIWCSDLEELLLMHEADIGLPATALWPRRRGPFPAVVMFDDTGRWASLRRSGWLAGVSRYLDRDATQAPVVLSVDLRGWGDSRPAPTAYDVAGWSGADRWPTYVANSLNDGLLGQRVRDAVASVRWLRQQPNVDANRVVLAGRGLGAVVALMSAAVVAPVAGVVCTDGPQSIEAIVAAERPGWDLDVFHPLILSRLDIPELIRGLGHVLYAGTRDGSGRLIAPADSSKIQEWTLSALGAL